MTPVGDPSAGLTLEAAARAVCEAFQDGKAPTSGWVEVLVAREDGRAATSGALELAIKRVAAKSYPKLELRSMRAELLWVEAHRPVKLQAGCIYKKVY